MAISNYWFLPTYENPRGLSIRDLFANFSLKHATKSYTRPLAFIVTNTY